MAILQTIVVHHIMNIENFENWKIDVLTEFEQLNQMKEEWNRLLFESQCDTINLRHEWLATVWKYYTSFDKTAKLCVFCVRQPNNELIAIFPLMTVKVSFKLFFRIKQVCFLGQDFNDYSGFIIKKNCEKSVLNFFFRSIVADSRYMNWDVLLFKNLSAKNEYLDYFRQLFMKELYDLEERVSTKYFYIKTNIGTFQDFFNARSKNFRNDLRKCQNRLERFSIENNKKINVIFADDRILDKQFIAMLSGWQIQRMKSVNKISSLTNKPARDFRYDFITNYYEYVLTVTLNMDGNPIAFCVCLIYKKTLFFWIHGADPMFYFLSPNKIILGKIIEYCFSMGYEYCDFNRGDHEYKEKWTQDYNKGFLLRTYNFRNPLIKLFSRRKTNN